MKILCLIPRYFDFLCSSIISGLKELSYEVFINNCDNSDIVLLFSNIGYWDRKTYVVKNNLINKTVYIDGSDSNCLEDPNALNDFKCVFKREVYLNDNQLLLPLPFAAENIYFKFNNLEKDINISCTLRCDYNKDRLIVNDAIKNLNIPNSIVGEVSSGYASTESTSDKKVEYYKVLARSKMSISYPGLGWDCGRFWEILANKCLLFSPKIKIKIPNTFSEFKHYIPFDNVEDLKAKLFYYYHHDEERQRIVNEAYNHLLKYHTVRARAKYLIDKINENLISTSDLNVICRV